MLEWTGERKCRFNELAHVNVGRHFTRTDNYNYSTLLSSSTPCELN